MSGQLRVTAPTSAPEAVQAQPWDSKDVDFEAMRLEAVQEVQRLRKEGKRAIAREGLSKLREKYKGTPAEAGYAAMLALDDYEAALDAHIEELKAERLRVTVPMEPDPSEPAPVETEQQAFTWGGMGGPEPIEGDAAQDYAAAVQATADDDAMRRMFDAYDEEEQGAGAAQLQGPNPVAQGATRAAAQPKAPTQAGSAQGTARAVRDAVTGATGDPLADTSTVLGDIAVGVGESPKAVLSGVAKGANELLGAIDSAGAFLATQAMLLEGDTEGAARLAKRRAGGETALEGAVPLPFKEPHSTTGKMIEGVSQFVTGFVAGGKVLKAAGVTANTLTTGFAKGAFSDAFAFDPARYRLSDLIEEFPELRNPVTEFLATKPGDSEAEGRLSNALEGLGLGTATTATFKLALTGMRAINSLRPPKPLTPAEVEEVALKQVKEGMAPLGDPDAPLIQTGPPRELPANQGTPHTFEAYDNAKIGTGEGTAMEGYGHYLAQNEAVAAEYQRGLSIMHGKAKIKSADGKVLWDSSVKRDGTPAHDAGYYLAHGGSFANARRLLAEESSAFTASEVKAISAKLDELEAAGATIAGGNKYKVAIDADAERHLLSLDDPVSAQSKSIQGMLTGLGIKINPGMNGRKIYDELTKKLGSKKAASDELSRIGLRGLKYLDQFSRNGKTAEKTHNYVIFDAKHLRKIDGAQAGGKDVFINFARIETPDDVKTLLQETANLHADEIAVAQRGVQSQEATKQLADDLGLSVNALLNRRRGPNGARVPFTAEEALAARRLHVASGEKLQELAEKAAGPNAGEIDLFNLRRMMTVHNAIQQEVLGARTETARALASWRIDAGAASAQLKSITAMMDTYGPDTRRLAQELVKLKQTGATPGAVASFVRAQGLTPLQRFGQGIKSWYLSSLLSGPLTHIVNATANLGTTALSVVERAVARSISKNVTGSNAVAAGEAEAMLFGQMEAQREAFRLAWKATGDAPENFLGVVESARVPAISSTGQGAFATTVNLIGATMNAPNVLLGSADQYFKAVNYRAELWAQAFRTASNEGLKRGSKDFAARVKDIVDNPPPTVINEASDFAMTQTFTNELGRFGKAIMSTRQVVPGAWMILPFVSTPVNIFRYAMERTPMAPLVKQWRADFARGGADRDKALAKVAVGTMVMGLAQTGVSNGWVTGARPSDPNEAATWDRLGRQEFSVKVGDAWYSYNRSDPFGFTMGIAASMEQTLARGETDPNDVDEWQEVLAATIAATASAATEKSFLRGFSMFNDAISDPERYAPQLLNSTVSGFVPFSSLQGWATRLSDPTVRDIKDPYEAIMSKMAPLAERIIPRRNLWGEVKRDELIDINAVSPFRVREETGSAIDAELERLRVFPEGIGWETSLDGTDVDFYGHGPALDEYRRLAGNGWKHPAWGLGLKDFLDQTVSGQGPMASVYRMYSDGEEGGKAAFIRTWITKYRQGAARELLSDPKHAKFRAYYDEQREAQRDARQRVKLD